VPTAKTEIEPGTEFPALSALALLAAKRNLPAESIAMATGVTGIGSQLVPSVKATGFPETVVAVANFPSDATGKLAMPVALVVKAGVAVTIT
jgi:hypothetical protein